MYYCKTDNNKPAIYCGASFAGIANQFQTFTQISEALREHIEKCPSVGALFVPMDMFMHVRNAVHKRGTIENMHYNKILDYQKELTE